MGPLTSPQTSTSEPQKIHLCSFCQGKPSKNSELVPDFEAYPNVWASTMNLGWFLMVPIPTKLTSFQHWMIGNMFRFPGSFPSNQPCSAHEKIGLHPHFGW
jgi:hypothetical protein